MKLDIAEQPLTILSKDRTKPQNMTTKYQRHMQKKNNFLWLKAVWDFEKIFFLILATHHVFFTLWEKQNLEHKSDSKCSTKSQKNQGKI